MGHRENRAARSVGAPRRAHAGIRARTQAMTVPEQAIETVARRMAIEWGGDWTDHKAAAAELLTLALPSIAAEAAAAERARIIDYLTHGNNGEGDMYDRLIDILHGRALTDREARP